MLDGFEIGKFVFDFKAEEDGWLPVHKGSTLRGGFGYTFKRLVCSHHQERCAGCESRSRCSYSYLFETLPTQTEDRFSNYSDIPRPFVLETDKCQRRGFARGDLLQFGLILMGTAIEYLPYFVFCFEELGKVGLGRDRVRFRLEEVRGFDFGRGTWLPLYDPEEHLLKGVPPVIEANQLPSDCGGTLSLEFLTPTRIKYRGKYVSDLEFHMLMRNLLRRISMITLFHCGFELDVDWNDLIAEAKMVEVRDWNLAWRNWTRRSTRQTNPMNLGGFMGTVTYSGNFDKFMPFIALGEQIHVGKNTTFGLGKYRIRRELDS